MTPHAHPPAEPAGGALGEFSLAPEDFAALAGIVQRTTGIQLPETKRPLMVSRLSKRLRALRLTSFAEYRHLIERGDDAGRDELARMISSLTTNVTRFFREGRHFEHLSRAVLPDLVARARAGDRVRLWSAGCSTGEEPYSLAFTLLSACPEAPKLDIRILATDIDPEVVRVGAKALYPAATLRALPPDQRSRWFKAQANGADTFEVAGAARDLVAFRVLNLMQDWPFRRGFDVIMCRNVVIYFDTDTQDRLWTRFAAHLPAGGRLYIGHSERISTSARRFFTLDGVTSYVRNDVGAGDRAGPPGRQHQGAMTQ